MGGTESAQITVIDSLLDISPIVPGSLGHTTALKSADVRVVVLAFESGHLLKEHSSPKALLMQALDGQLRVTAAGRTVDLLPGGLIRLDALLHHEVEAVGDSRLMLTRCSPKAPRYCSKTGPR